mmetsp:Transcript_2739/g.4217  ORF Transcript_2739/g.4217 Transcript_2739/m.4217 type:complete len:205 (+) Transcript_2739:984-1598(+)
MAGLPLIKLAAMFVKQISKPIASRMKVEASRNESFADICGRAGQVSHQIYSRINIIASGYRIVGVKPLPHDAAVTEGITIISECIMYTVAGSLIIYEYSRNEAKNALKAKVAAEKEAIFRADLDRKFSELQSMHSKLSERLDVIESRLQKIQTNQSIEPIVKPPPAMSWLSRWHPFSSGGKMESHHHNKAFNVETERVIEPPKS